MFDIGFSELLLVLVIGLVVLGPERLPVAVRTVSGWIRTLRSLAASVQHEISQELKLQELQESLKKAEQAGVQNLTPELKASMDELKEVTESLARSCSAAPKEVTNIPSQAQIKEPFTEVQKEEAAASSAIVENVDPVAVKDKPASQSNGER